jgi:transcriptional regulator with XRE-family HTH domain
MRVGQRLVELRKAEGLSQAALARRLSVSPATISSYETGRAQIDADDLPRFAHVLHVAVSALVDEGPEPPRLEVEDIIRELQVMMSKLAVLLSGGGAHYSRPRIVHYSAEPIANGDPEDGTTEHTPLDWLDDRLIRLPLLKRNSQRVMVATGAHS